MKFSESTSNVELEMLHLGILKIKFLKKWRPNFSPSRAALSVPREIHRMSSVELISQSQCENQRGSGSLVF